MEELYNILEERLVSYKAVIKKMKESKDPFKYEKIRQVLLKQEELLSIRKIMHALMY